MPTGSRVRRIFIGTVIPPGRAASWACALLSALPRPDSDGLVMNQVWALKAEGVRGVAPVGAVGSQVPALLAVLQVGHHDLVEDLAVDGGVFDGHQRFHPPVHVARHPVGRADEHLGMARRQPVAVAEADDAAMLEEAADDALDPDVLRQARHAGAQAADAADHQVDLHPGLRGARTVRRSAWASTSEFILAQMRGRLAGLGVVDLALDQVHAASCAVVSGAIASLSIFSGRA